MGELVDTLVKTVQVIHRDIGSETAHEYFMSIQHILGSKISEKVFNLLLSSPEFNKYYRVRLVSTGERRINQIKIYRQYTGSGLKDAKDMIESAPCEFEIKGLDNVQAYIHNVAELGGKAELI